MALIAVEQKTTEWVAPLGRNWKEDDGRRMVAALVASGETAVAFGTRHGIPADKVARWHRRLGKAQKSERPEQPVRFAPVRLVEQNKMPSRQSEVAPSTLEVLLRGGRVVRVGRDFDARHLCEVVAALEGEARC